MESEIALVDDDVPTSSTLDSLSDEISTWPCELITTTEKAKLVVAYIVRNYRVVGLDGYGQNIWTDPINGKLSILSLATRDGKHALFDLFSNPQIMTETGLDKLLKSRKIIKVIYNSSILCCGLLTNFSVKLHRVFDLHCAHALRVQQETGMDRRLVPIEPLSILCELYGNGLINIESLNINREYKFDNALWESRPAGQDVLDYTIRNVTALLPEVYDTLSSLIQDHQRKGFDYDCKRWMTQHVFKILQLIPSLELEIVKCENELNDLKKVQEFCKMIGTLLRQSSDSD